MSSGDQNEIDKADLARFAAGDEMGMNALIKRYSSPLVNHSTYLLGAHGAEDVVQDSFIKLWQHADRLLASTEPLYIRAWLFRVVRNASLDRLRRKANANAELDENLVDSNPSVEEALDRSEKAQQVMGWISTLPERQKSALLLAHFEGMSNPEIATILDASVEAVENLLARARRRLRELAHNESVED